MLLQPGALTFLTILWHPCPSGISSSRWSSCPIRPLDLVSGVRGVQVPQSATTIEWPGSLATIAPTLEQDS